MYIVLIIGHIHHLRNEPKILIFGYNSNGGCIIDYTLFNDKYYSICLILDDLVDSDTHTNAYILSLISSILY